VIDAKELQTALGLRSEYLATRVLVGLDRNRDGVISHDEFIAGVRKLVFGTERERLEFAFRMHDDKGDGFIDREELLRMISISLYESDLTTRASMPPQRLAAELMARADSNGDGRISFEEFETVVRAHPDLLVRMTRSEALWIAPSEDLLARLKGPALREGRFARFFENEWPQVLFLFFWLCAMVAVFARTMFLGGAVYTHFLSQLGSATGKCMSLCGALILVPIMRRMLTKLRATFLHRLVPFDDAILFHKILGHTLFGLGLVHAACLVGAYAQGHPNLLHVVTTSRGASGLALLAVFAIMWTFAQGFVRRSSRFELFYFTHLLYGAWFLLAIVHAPFVLAWFGLPLVGFAIEQVVRTRRRGRETRVISARALQAQRCRLCVRAHPGNCQARMAPVYVE
jgi:NADPH oxidase 5